MSSKIEITLKPDGNVNFSIDKDTSSRVVIDGMITALVGIIGHVSRNYETQDTHIRYAVNELNKSKMMTREHRERRA